MTAISQSPPAFSPESLPNVADVHLIRGADAAVGDAPDLLVEIPHGATATADFEELAAQLEGPHPAGLADFFHVNTDVGAFELALATAERLVAAEREGSVLIVRCRIPRTFIDCNRRIELRADAFREGGVTPGVMPWVRSPADREFLRGRYDAYLSIVAQATAALSADAAVVLLHTYGPRTVGVEVDENIVQSLHAAYAPGVVETWPMRPELDVISRSADGANHAPKPVVDALRRGVEPFGWTLGESATYPLHPSALAWDHVMARPGRALCLEVRRDLLADPFEPFAEMHICPNKVARIADPLAEALRGWGAESTRPSSHAHGAD